MINPTNKLGITILLICLAVVLIPVFTLRIDPREYEGGRSRDAVARSTRNASSIAVLFGELRTSMSDMMFIKTERYLHSGVAYVPHHDEQLLSVEDMGDEVDHHQADVQPHHHTHSHGHSHSHDHPHVHHTHDGDHAGTPTLIPTRDQDYRGFIGRLHRQVKPWRDPTKAHIHTDGTELLPWFRVMTVTDPHYAMGYTLGSWWVAQYDRDMALDFIEEGIRHNPNAFQIRMARGFILWRTFRQEREDMQMLDQVIQDFRDAARLGIAQRPDPADGPPEEQPGWSWFQEQDLWAACQMRVLLEREFGDPERARELAAEYLEIFPDNKVLAGFLDTNSVLQ